MAKKKEINPVITENRKANYDYFLSDFLEVGIVLTGTEIKSIRQSGTSLKDTFVSFRNGEAFLEGLHIAPYAFGNIFNHEPRRSRKLLMHKKEIKKYALDAQIAQMTVVPTKMYFVRGRVKVAIALGKGKKHYDKRETIKAREDDIAMQKAKRRGSDDHD
ncbi:MAG: SsrA-binding protein SmpB [Bacilli bacterium]|nr:SsrA-binding protein SmpB [Bacilli bacterium]